MSLDVYLETDTPIARSGSGIFIREDGRIKEITRAEWDERCPGHEATILAQTIESTVVFQANIMHNLGVMASAAGIYLHLWIPEEIGITTATQIIEPLRAGISWLMLNPDTAREYSPKNGGGTYEGFLRFVNEYLQACEAHRTARVSVSRCVSR